MSGDGRRKRHKRARGAGFLDFLKSGANALKQAKEVAQAVSEATGIKPSSFVKNKLGNALLASQGLGRRRVAAGRRRPRRAAGEGARKAMVHAITSEGDMPSVPAYSAGLGRRRARGDGRRKRGGCMNEVGQAVDGYGRRKSGVATVMGGDGRHHRHHLAGGTMAMPRHRGGSFNDVVSAVNQNYPNSASIGVVNF